MLFSASLEMEATMREIQAETIGDRRVRLLVNEADRYAVTIEVWGQRDGKILACAPIRTCRSTGLVSAIVYD